MEAIFWQSKKDAEQDKPLKGSALSFLVLEGSEIRKFTLIPFQGNYLVVRAASEARWSTQEYWDEKSEAGAKKLGIAFADGAILDFGSFRVRIQKGLPEVGKHLGLIEKQAT